MTVDELRAYREKHHEKRYMVIDVRQPVEYEAGHIPGAILLPLDEFEETVETLPQKHMIYYCRNGTRSRAAALTADFFNDAGKEIYNLQGGILSWDGFQVEGVPSVKIFDLEKPMDEILTDAMDLEKGAFYFYSHVLENYPDLDLEKVLRDVRDGELGHAKLIYSHLKKIVPDSHDFETIYSELKGDILESGQALDVLIASFKQRKGDLRIDILESAVAMEYRAFDLYRVISEKTKERALKEVFYSLSQAEKSHMNILIAVFEKIVGSSLKNDNLS